MVLLVLREPVTDSKEIDLPALMCSQCHTEYPSGTDRCPADGANLVGVTNDPLIGNMFAEKYEVLSLIGEGGMSRVYRAKHTYMGRVDALKLLHEHMTSDAVAAERFKREAQSASCLSHQNVVAVHDFGFTSKGQAYLIMDCLEGQSLEEILETTGRLPLKEALGIFVQACDGLEHAHRKGIIHRDIKPSNLVIARQEDGTDLVKIVDFGIAKAVSEEARRPQQHLTQTGEIFGTPAYMSPEQCEGRQLDARSDLYSFGCLMYETLAGEPPLLGDTFINTVVKQINEKPKSFSAVAPHADVPPPVEAVIMKCLEKDPGHRYDSAFELRQALLAAAAASGVDSVSSGRIASSLSTLEMSPVSRPSRSGSLGRTLQSLPARKKAQYGGVLAFVLAMVGFLVWYFVYFPGPTGDEGPVYLKVMWQNRMAYADECMKEGRYDDAVRALEDCRKWALDFRDNKVRLEKTLSALVDAYKNTRNYGQVEVTNKELGSILLDRVLAEYTELMGMLDQWSKPAGGEAKEIEKRQQADAFADRIAKAAQKLSISSRQKAERLLLRAIDVFEKMELANSSAVINFKLELADLYQQQQQFELLRKALEDAVRSCPARPSGPEQWRLKVRAILALGQLDRNEGRLDEAQHNLSSSIAMIKTRLGSDPELLRDAYNAYAELLKNKGDLTGHAEYEKMADTLEEQLNRDN